MKIAQLRLPKLDMVMSVFDETNVVFSIVCTDGGFHIQLLNKIAALRQAFKKRMLRDRRSFEIILKCFIERGGSLKPSQNTSNSVTASLAESCAAL